MKECWDSEKLEKKAMPLITLLSDWGQDDYYLAEVKLRLHALLPDCHVLDISHGLHRDDLLSAAFVMYNLYSSMPENTVHILGIQDIASVGRPHLLVRAGGQYFIGADNGFFEYFQWISGRKVDEVREIEVWQDSDFTGIDVYTFPSRDLFPKVAAMIVQGCDLDQIGHPVQLELKALQNPMSNRVMEKDKGGSQIGCRINGNVLYIDHFGNACTNIRKSEYEECLRQYPFSYMVVNGKKVYKAPVRAYQDLTEGSLLGIFLKNGFLEISIHGDHAANLLGLSRGSRVNILFGQSRLAL